MGRYTIDAAATAGMKTMPDVDDAVRDLAEAILRESQALCPVDTGALRASGFVDGHGSEYTVGYEKDYAPYVEFGTRHMNPQPYLSPAALKRRSL